VALHRTLEHVRRIAGRLHTGGEPRRGPARTPSAVGRPSGRRSRWGHAFRGLLMVAAGLVSLVLLAGEHRSSERSVRPVALQSGGTVVWSTGMEDGTLDGWGGAALNGGGEFDSGSGVSTASRDVAHSGSWSAEMTLADGSGGTRLLRWQEPRAYRDLVFSAWFYIPRTYTLTGDPSGRFWNVFQFKSRSTTGSVDPMWDLIVDNPAPGRMRINLDWSPRTLQGPLPGQSGWRRFTQSVADVPAGRWFQLTAELRQSNAFDGSLRVWQDGELLFDLTGIRTTYLNCAYNSWCGSNEWSINNYSDALSPAPSVIYADDANIALPAAPSPAPGPAAPPSPVAQPADRPFSGLIVKRRQRGTFVRGRVRIARAGSRFAAVLHSEDRRRVAGRARARRVQAGILHFRVSLTRAQRLRLRRRHSLSLRLRITVTPPGGARASAERRVDLRRSARNHDRSAS
jgi:hypothetical protein